MTSHGTYRFNWAGPDAASPIVSHGIKVLDLAAETSSIASAQDPERTARTLARLDTLRLTLMRLKSGAKVKQHHTDHELSIHTVTGRLLIHTPLERFELSPGHVAVLERGLVHDIEALEESAILLTIALSHHEEAKPPESDNPPAED
jgi:quercetin dioxygenase-like cupin family protein